MQDRAFCLITPQVIKGLIVGIERGGERLDRQREDRKSTRLNSSHSQISYAVFCLKKKKRKRQAVQQGWECSCQTRHFSCRRRCMNRWQNIAYGPKRCACFLQPVVNGPATEQLART